MASYNGRFFDGGYSGHNVKIKNNGKTRDYISENINNTLEQVPLLKNIEWHYGDYSELNIPEHSLIYCDIPYKDTKQYSTSKNFDYNRFYDWCRLMSRKGHRVLNIIIFFREKKMKNNLIFHLILYFFNRND